MSVRIYTTEGYGDGDVVSAGTSGTSGNQLSLTGKSAAATLLASSIVAAHGTKSTQITLPDDNDYGALYYTVNSVNAIATRLYLYLSAYPTSTTEFIRLFSSGSVGVASLYLKTSGAISIFNATGSSIHTMSGTIPLNQWVRLELSATVGVSSTTGRIQAAWGIADAVASDSYDSGMTLNTGSATITTVQAGKASTATQLSGVFYLDDFTVDDTTSNLIGPVSNTNKSPIADAGSDVVAIEPYTKQNLNGTDNDTDGTVITRTWRQLSGTSVSLVGTGANRTYDVPGTLAGETLVFGYTVTDDGGLSSLESTVNHEVLPVTERAIRNGVEVPLNNALIKSSVVLDQTWTVKSGALVRRGYTTTSSNDFNTGYIAPPTSPVMVNGVSTPVVRYEDLLFNGETLNSAAPSIVLARLTQAAVVTLPEGEFIGNDFATGYYACIDIPKVCKGLWGSGRGTLGGTTGTIFSIAAHSSTKGGIPGAPTQTQGGTTQCTVLRQLSGTGGFILKNIQIRGTDQGHNFHGVEISNNVGSVTFDNVFVNGWQGNNGSPPGETFGSSIYNAGGGSTIINSEADGRRAIGGTVYGAVGFTVGKQYGSTWNNIWSHHCRAACVVFYRSFHVRTNNVRTGSLTDPGPDLVGGPWNHENSGDIIHTDMTLQDKRGNTGVNITFSNGNFSGSLQGHTVDATNGSLTLINPTYTSLYPDNLLYIQSWTSGIDGGSPDTMATAPLVTTSNGTTHLTYKWVHGSHQTIT
jgi:hypothetical protein